MTSEIISCMQLTTCQLRGHLPQLHPKDDSIKPVPKAMNNIYSLEDTSGKRNSEKQKLARILGSFL